MKCSRSSSPTCATPVGAASICPGKIEVLALGLPWHSHLAEFPPIRDVLEGVAIEIRCKKGMSYGVFSGHTQSESRLQRP